MIRDVDVMNSIFIGLALETYSLLSVALDEGPDTIVALLEVLNRDLKVLLYLMDLILILHLNLSASNISPLQSFLFTRENICWCYGLLHTYRLLRLYSQIIPRIGGLLVAPCS